MMLGLGAFTAIFAGAVVLAYQAGPKSDIGQWNAAAPMSFAKDAIDDPSPPTLVQASATELAGERTPHATPRSANVRMRFEACGEIRVTCIVDGDTFWLEGQKIRIADIDTPEISQPQCQQEYDLGMTAKSRLTQLLNEGPFELRASGGRNEDGYGRLLRLVFRNGESIGDQLVEEGLAHRWIGHKQPWC
jgi:micrococcal nuclease